MRNADFGLHNEKWEDNKMVIVDYHGKTARRFPRIVPGQFSWPVIAAKRPRIRPRYAGT